jgi:FkbM family methyltransferase
MYYSQQQEDQILFEKFLNYKNGVFVELGAMDGLKYSNTLFFEKELNWSGVLIEPTDQFEQLKINRKDCKNYNYAVSITEGEVEFLGNGPLGGMTHTMNPAHRIGWNLDNSFSPCLVKSIPIYKILSEANIKKIDLFSIDTEGSEIEVLKTFDWNIPVYVILIELSDSNDSIHNDRNKECRDIMLKNNFTFEMTIGCNEVWINKNFKH